MEEETTGKIYKQLSAGMREELRQIYRQISHASMESCSQEAATAELFNEASSQLKEIVKTTEDAAMNIMDIVENQLAGVDESQKLLSELQQSNPSPEVERLCQINDRLGNALTDVLAALGFQDITGQRLRKVSEALGAIEKSVRELYISSGLMLEAAEKNPVQDVRTLQSEAQKAVRNFEEQRISGSELKGPDRNGATQAAIDDMLSQLGL